MAPGMQTFFEVHRLRGNLTDDQIANAVSKGYMTTDEAATVRKASRKNPVAASTAAKKKE